jgi:hypothetical protein
MPVRERRRGAFGGRGGGLRLLGRRRQRCDQRPGRRDLPVLRETPVEQLLSRVDLGQRRAVQQRDDQRDPVPPGHADVGRSRRAGPADFAADAARVIGEQGVLVPQPDLLMRRDREQPALRLVVFHERGQLQCRAGDQRQVVRGGVLAGRVQAVRVDRVRVIGLEVLCLGVDQRHAAGQ